MLWFAEGTATNKSNSLISFVQLSNQPMLLPYSYPFIWGLDFLVFAKGNY